MPLGSKKLLNLFELVSTGQLNPPAALDIALGKAQFPGEAAPVAPPAPAVNDDMATKQAEVTEQAEVVATPATTTPAEPAQPTPITTPEQRLELECERIRALANVREVTLTKKNILVFTDIIYCTDLPTKVVHELGRFRIEIPLAGSVIRWFNLDRQAHGYQAPQVWPQGDAILGSLSNVFPGLLQQREFSVAVTMAIAFLESTDGTAVRMNDLSGWPVARKK